MLWGVMYVYEKETLRSYPSRHFAGILEADTLCHRSDGNE
jgi:hypothetical protein